MIQRIHHKWVKYVLIFVFFLAANHSLYAQFKEDHSDSFGAGFYQDINGLVKGRNALTGQYIHGRRTFEMGILLDHFSSHSGFIFRHQFYLNRTRGRQEFHPADFSVRPYLVYNFIYNKGISENHLRSNPGSSQINFNQDIQQVPIINTIEHYFGLGTELDLAANVYLNVYAGGGLYFYRNDSRMVNDHDQLLPEQITGFTWNMSVGVGYRFY